MLHKKPFSERVHKNRLTNKASEVKITDFFLQAIINGLLMGGVYALASSGLSLVYGTMKIVNFCQGEFLMLGMYCSFFIFAFVGLEPFISWPITMLAMFALGAITYFACIRRVIHKTTLVQVFMTFSLLLLFQNLALLFWKPDPRTIVTLYSDTSFSVYDLFLVHLPKLVTFILALGVMIALHFFIKKSSWGLIIRATAENHQAAALLGIDTDRVYLLVYALATAITGVAGALLATFYPASPFVGAVFIAYMFTVCVLGGLGNYLGAVTGGVVIGLTESLSAYFISPGLKSIGVFCVLILVLCIKQKGFRSK